MFSSGSETEDSPVRKPIGRIATLIQQGRSEESDAPNNAYERVKAMLMGNGNKADHEHPSDSLSDEVDISTNREQVPSPTDQKSHHERSLAPQESVPRRKSGTPGLFVSSAEPSPEKPSAELPGTPSADSESDLPEKLENNKRFKELLARKRAELRAQRDAERQWREERLERLTNLDSLNKIRVDSSEGASGSDEEIEKKLTRQSGRPAPRKASKRAMEEMNRETQRISRNMQLAHQAKTKKKYTTNDLFKTFGFRQEQAATEERQRLAGSANNAQHSEPVSSDLEGGDLKSTPPTSPPNHDEHGHKVIDCVPKPLREDNEAGEFGMDNIQMDARSLQRIGKKAQDSNKESSHLIAATPTALNNVAVQRAEIENTHKDESDSDDLEIVHRKPSRFAVFDRLPAKKKHAPKPLKQLRMLAHLTSPDKVRVGKRGTSMAQAELQTLLQRRARQQALLEREEKIQELKARGIFIQTEEEKEKEQLELENMLEKARQADIELAKKEKEATKAGNKEGAVDILESDDEDEDWQAGEDDGEEDGDDEEEDDEDIILSGSDDEDDPDSEASDIETGKNVFVEAEADESSDGEVDADTANGESDSDSQAKYRHKAYTRRRNVVEDDDDDSDSNTRETQLQSQPQPNSTSNDIAAVFGFPKSSPALGLTQMFTGSMADTASALQPERESTTDSKGTPLDVVRRIPVSTFPNLEMPEPDGSQTPFIRNGQTEDAQREPTIEATQEQCATSQVSPSPSMDEELQTQLSQFPDPTQDVGFQMSSSPAGVQQVPSSTVDTAGESPAVKRKGRLRCRNERDKAPVLSDLDDEDVVPEVGSDSDVGAEITANAFSIMRKATKKQHQDDFDKKKSGAREMVEEQAEESEDEYAGLGGASDDDSGEEVDEEIAKMIDESDIKVDESKIAALFAEKDREEDEKRIDKLYKDITNGALRRKRGADFDLSDSDDDAAERRRRKQREFARMRKALLEDENIGKIAENPKRQAFLRAIEDHDSDAELDFLDERGEAPDSIPDSQQPQEPDVAGAGSIAPVTDSRKQKAPFNNDENHPPLHPRRTAPTGNRPPTLRKPVTLAEIRESVSFLIEDSHMVPDSQFESSESDADVEMEASTDDALNNGTVHVATRRTSSTVIDRLSLSRTSTNLSETSTGSLAFAGRSKGNGQGRFKVPSLLRRATSRLSEAATSSNDSSASSSGCTTPVENTKVRRGGNARSNIHYQAREAERRRVIEAAEEKRKAGLKKKLKAGGSEGLKNVLSGATGWD